MIRNRWRVDAYYNYTSGDYIVERHGGAKLPDRSYEVYYCRYLKPQKIGETKHLAAAKAVAVKHARAAGARA